MPSPAVLIVGDLFSNPMQPVRECVEGLVERGADTRFVAARSVGDPGRFLPQEPDAAWFPDLVIVCQLCSDEFTEADVRRLLGLFPLARFVCCYGPWCESDGRTRDIWPLAVRVPARFAADRVRRELEVIQGVRPPLPLTASRDEIFLFDADSPAGDRLAWP